MNAGVAGSSPVLVEKKERSVSATVLLLMKTVELPFFKEEGLAKLGYGRTTGPVGGGGGLQQGSGNAVEVLPSAALQLISLPFA